MRKHKVPNIFNYFWKNDTGLTIILIILCLSNFIAMPFYTVLPLVKVLTLGFWTLILFSGISYVSKNRLQMIVLSVIPISFLTFNIFSIFSDISEAAYIQLFINFISYCLIIGLLFVKVFEEGPVTMHRIIGAVAIYIFIGTLWSEAYRFIYDHIPGSFILPVSETADNITPGAFLYFSFETITTTGYGEFIPVHPIARTLAVIEQLIGVMYPIILIGRLVSLKVESSKTIK
jgi:hypothetical protein